MNDNKIAEIRARYEEDEQFWKPAGDSRPRNLIDRGILLAEVQRLRLEVKHLRQARNDALAGGDILKRVIERLREALMFYADRRLYRTTTVHMCGHSVGQPVTIDGGERARKALEGG